MNRHDLRNRETIFPNRILAPPSRPLRDTEQLFEWFLPEMVALVNDQRLKRKSDSKMWCP